MLLVSVLNFAPTKRIARLFKLFSTFCSVIKVNITDGGEEKDDGKSAITTLLDRNISKLPCER